MKRNLNRNIRTYIIVAIFIFYLGLFTFSRYLLDVNVNGREKLEKSIIKISAVNKEDYDLSTSGYVKVQYEVSNTIDGKINQQNLQYYIKILNEDGSSNQNFIIKVRETVDDNANFDNVTNCLTEVPGKGFGPISLKDDGKTEETKIFDIYIKCNKPDLPDGEIPLKVHAYAEIKNLNNIIRDEKADLKLDIKNNLEYSITFETNEGTLAQGQKDTFKAGETVELLAPTKTNNEFLGWYKDEEFNDGPFTEISGISEDITLYAKWNKIRYQNSSYTFDGTSSYIDTGVSLFSNENWDKDFEISFNVQNSSGNVQGNTIFSEVNNNNLGLLFDFASSSSIELSGNDSNSNEKTSTFTQTNMNSMKIIRKGGVIYYSQNSGVLVPLIKNTNIPKFDNSLVFGAILDENGNASNLFKGTLTNILVQFTEEEEDSTVKYRYNGIYNGNGSECINTGVQLFNDENKDKNFEIEFTVLDEASSQTNQATILGGMSEAGSPYPGIVYRKYSGQFEGQINATRAPQAYKYYSITNSTGYMYVRITRENGTIKYFVDSNTTQLSLDTTGITAFDTPITFGGGLNGSNNPFRYYNGEIANMKIRVWGGSSSGGEVDPDTSTIFEYTSSKTFSGKSDSNITSDDYINTNIYPFSSENWGKDFEITLDIDSYGTSQVAQAVIIGAMDESGSPWPGFLFRIESGSPRIVGNVSGSTNNRLINNEVNSIGIKRENNVLYYAINGGTYTSLVDLTNMPILDDLPITIGAGLSGTRTPMRNFNGTISNIVIKGDLTVGN